MTDEEGSNLLDNHDAQSTEADVAAAREIVREYFPLDLNDESEREKATKLLFALDMLLGPVPKAQPDSIKRPSHSLDLP